MKKAIMTIMLSFLALLSADTALQEKPDYYITQRYNTTPEHCGGGISLSPRDRTSGSAELDFACLIAGSRNIAWRTVEEVKRSLDLTKEDFEEAAKNEHIREFKGISFRPEGERNALLLVLLKLEHLDDESDYLHGLLLGYPFVDLEFFYQRIGFHSYLNQLGKTADSMLWTYPEFSEEQKELFERFIKDDWQNSKAHGEFEKDKAEADAWLKKHESYSTEELYALIKIRENEIWQAMGQKVDSLAQDALGQPIDPEMKELIIALNLHGIKTEASSKGHLDCGAAYPWVDLEAENDELTDIKDKHTAILKPIAEIEDQLRKKHPDLSLIEAIIKEQPEDLTKLFQEEREIVKLMEKIFKVDLMRLKHLLAQFYEEQPEKINLDNMLAIEITGLTSARLSNLGGEWQITRSDTEKAAKLREYQQEMKKFAAFLRKIYFDHY